MRKTTGSAAGLVALLAFLLHTQFPSASEATGGAVKTAQASEASKERAGGQESEEEPADRPLKTILDHFRSESDLVATWSVVATVPDPLHTRMALHLDAQIEAIQHSLQAAGWEFARQWLPWNDRFDSSEHDINQRRRQRRLQAQTANQPGILIFRSAIGGLSRHRLLYVWLAPETPTSGISAKPFLTALDLADKLTSENRIGLLAPTFSGSFPSLTALVRMWKAGHPGRLHRVAYGSALSLEGARAFRAATDFEYHGGSLDAPDYMDVYCKSLQRYGLGDRAALLKEDDTAYATALGTTSCPIPIQQYVFPRDISHLRNANQEGTTPAARNPYADAFWNLNFSIRDSANGEDSIPIYSETQTPLAQYAVIDSIGRELARNETQAVLIAATNSLDSLFLMRAIRRMAPNTRIFVQNPDILFIPAASRDPLSGTLMLSTYPMFAKGEMWLSGRQEDRLIFPNSSVQGIYNATQLLLGDIKAPMKGMLRGYHQFSGDPYPGMWVLTLTPFGFVPVDYHERRWSEMTPQGLGGCIADCNQWFRNNPDQAAAKPVSEITILPPRSWRVTVFAVNLIAILGSLLCLRCNLSPVPRKPYWLMMTEGVGLRLQALLAVVLSLTVVQWILICPGLLPLRGLFSAVELMGLALPILTILYIGFLSYRRIRGNASERARWGIGIRSLVYPVAMIAVFLAVAGCWTYVCWFQPFPNAAFLRFRAVELYSGSSPAGPLLILASAVLLVSLSYFKRYTVSGPYRPRFEHIAPQTDDRAAVVVQEKLVAAAEAIERHVLAPSRLGVRGALLRTGAGVIFVLLCLRILGSFPSAFEDPVYNWALWVALSLVLFWLCIGCWDLRELWKGLRAMLKLMEVLRLQPALKRVSRDWPKRPVWAFRKSVSKQRLQQQMLNALHERLVALEALAESKEAAAQLYVVAGSGSTWRSERPIVHTLTAAMETAEIDHKDFRDALDGAAGAAGNSPGWIAIASGNALPGAARELRGVARSEKLSARIAARILEQDLRPWWRESHEDEELKKPTDALPREAWLYRRCCSDFLTLHCCRYVMYSVEHVRRIATYVSISFLLLLVCFHAYSPQGPQVVARFVAVLFLGIGYLMVKVFAEMERNPILSRMSRTNPDELNAEFWVRLVSLGALPLLGVLAHLFPSVSGFLFQWIAPGVQSLH